MNNNGNNRKKDSARIVWDSKPRRAPNPNDIEFQTAEVVIPNPEAVGQLPISFRDKLFGEEELDKPYLKLQKPEIKGNAVTIDIEKYVLYDFPLGSGKKSDEDREEMMRLVKDNFAVLIDYWAVDWDYDGLTFKSQWQDLRG